MKKKEKDSLLIQFFPGLLLIFLLVMLLLLFSMSFPAIAKFGLSFFFHNEWDPVNDAFGAGAFIHGTLGTSLFSLLLATPLSVGLALFVVELCPRGLSTLLCNFIELLAAIPGLIYGMWALSFLAPIIKDQLAPFLQGTLGLGHFFLFKGPSFGIGPMMAIMVLTMMIIPTITMVCIEVFRGQSPDLKQAALALGCERWETIVLSLLRPGSTGILGAVILGWGRAIGETMATAMVIGNKPDISFSLFTPASTMASVIANEYAEATSEMHMASLCYIGLLLFAISFVINGSARFLVWKVGAKK